MTKMKTRIYRYYADCKLNGDAVISPRFYLNNLNYCNEFMTELVKRLGMQEIGRIAHYIGGNSFPDSPGGVSIAVIFLESGAQLHTWSEEEEFYLDVVSCKKFDPEQIDNLISYYFNQEPYQRVFASYDEKGERCIDFTELEKESPMLEQ